MASSAQKSPTGDRPLDQALATLTGLSAPLAATERSPVQQAGRILVAIAQDPNAPAPDRLRARLGLVTAHRLLGNRDQAIALAQPLIQNNSAKIRQLAQRALGNLATTSSLPTPPPARSPAPNQETTAGFIPFDAPAGPAAPGRDAGNPASRSPETPDTGFVPFLPEPAGHPAGNPVGNQPPRSARDRPPVPATSAPGSLDLGLDCGDSPQANSNTHPDHPPHPSTPTRILSSPDAGLPGAEAMGVIPDLPLRPGEAPLASPADAVPSPPPPADPTTYQPPERSRDRAKHWATLPFRDGLQYGLLQAGTILALGWLITQLSAWVVQIHDSIAWVMVRQFYWMPLVNQWGYLDEPPITLLVVGLAIAFVGTPWLWDAWLIKRCQAKPLRVLELANQKPETTRLLQRHCRQARLPLPRLRLLPDAVPIIFSYGCLPQQARIVISQGLLDQLDDAALAGMMAGELSRILRWDFTVMSWGVLILQIPYGIYRVGADCANRWTLPVSRWLAVGTSVIGYGLFRLLRWPLLPLARKRTWLGDRYAVNLTGNPNGIAQGWLNWVTAWAGAIAQTGHIPTRLEAWELLLPLSVESAITIGSCAPHSPLEPILRWEHTNPYRHWLALNQSHPTWGDRLAALMHLAQRWKLDPAWDLQDDTARALARQYLPTWPEQRRCLPPAATTLWLQAAPYLGAILGMAIALFLWIPGAASIALSQRALSWMYGDPSLILGLACVGASLGIFWRINAFFPDIRWENLPVLGSPELPLASGLVDANALPVNPMPVRLKGRLLGRSPWLGALGQGWLLETPTGTIALHWQHPWGPLGKLWVCEKQRNSLLGRQVVVTGWLRRGATPWIDVDLLNRATVSDQSLARTSQTRVNGHPLWSTTGAILTALLGILVLYAGL